jgi:hypothetical protein
MLSKFLDAGPSTLIPLTFFLQLLKKQLRIWMWLTESTDAKSKFEAAFVAMKSKYTNLNSFVPVVEMANSRQYTWRVNCNNLNKISSLHNLIYTILEVQVHQWISLQLWGKKYIWKSEYG